MKPLPKVFIIDLLYRVYFKKSKKKKKKEFIRIFSIPLFKQKKKKKKDFKLVKVAK